MTALRWIALVGVLSGSLTTNVGLAQECGTDAVPLTFLVEDETVAALVLSIERELTATCPNVEACTARAGAAAATCGTEHVVRIGRQRIEFSVFGLSFVDPLEPRSSVAVRTAETYRSLSHGLVPEARPLPPAESVVSVDAGSGAQPSTLEPPVELAPRPLPSLSGSLRVGAFAALWVERPQGIAQVVLAGEVTAWPWSTVGLYIRLAVASPSMLPGATAAAGSATALSQIRAAGFLDVGLAIALTHQREWALRVGAGVGADAWAARWSDQLSEVDAFALRSGLNLSLSYRWQWLELSAGVQPSFALGEPVLRAVDGGVVERWGWLRVESALMIGAIFE